MKTIWNNLNLNGKIAFASITSLFVLAILSLILGFFTSLRLLESFRIVFGSVYVLFLPGFILTFLFFPNKLKDQKIDSIERIALSFALSIAVVPLVIFYLNLIGLKISSLNTTISIAGIILIELIIIFFIGKRRF